MESQKSRRFLKIGTALFLLMLWTAPFRGGPVRSDEVLKPAPSPATSEAVEANNKSVHIGVFRQGAPRQISFINEFESQIGRRVSIIMWYQDFSNDFPRADADKVVSHGAMPHIIWEPWMWGDTATDSSIHLSDLISGKWDRYMTKWAQGAKEWGHPFFLRFAHEFNIEGYPWGIVNNSRNPELYAKAWRHVHDIFKKVGATNVRWVWCFMNESWPQMGWNDYTKAYPGDAYVDWIGIDGYNWGTTQSWSTWRTFTELFRKSAREAWRRYPGKPIMIAEFATTEEGGNKGEWIRNLAVELQAMPYIKAVNWFDQKKEAAWQVKSSAAALAGFRTLAKNPIFGGHVADLATMTPTQFQLSVIRKTAEAAHVTSPIHVDGNLEEWKGAKAIELDQQSLIQEGTFSWRGLQDLSGKVYVAWDGDALYVAADVRDDHPLVNDQTGADIWNGDAVEVALSTNPGADPRRFEYTTQDFQIGLGTGNEKGNPPSIWIWQKKGAVIGAKIAVKRTADGYNLEARIPWENFGTFRPRKDVKIGFEAALDDADKDERRLQMVWNGDFLFYKDPGVWGWLTFSE